MGDVKYLTSCVELNRAKFARMRGEILSIEDPERRCAAIYDAAFFASHTGTGVFRAPDLDHLLVQLALELPTCFPPRARRGVLHVMSRAYPNGGHTRVVERWIKQDSDCRVHSLITTEQSVSELPRSLSSCVGQFGGSVYGMTRKDGFLRRAGALRELAQSFECVVIHAHMYDVVPFVALGTCHDLPRIFFNHADHRFSLGMTQIPTIAESRVWGQSLSQERRGVPDSEILGIPVRERLLCPVHGPVKRDLRRTLGLPEEAVIGIVAGSAHKFVPTLNYDIFRALDRCFRVSKNFHVLMLGPKKDELSRFSKDIRFGNFVTVVSPGSENWFSDCVQASDFALDTFPENGCTTLMDMLQLGRPVVSLCAPTGQMDYLLGDDAVCADEDSFVTRVSSFFDASVRTIAFERQFSSLVRNNGVEVFKARLDSLYSSAVSEKSMGFRAAGIRNEAASVLDLLLCHRGCGLS